MCKGIINKQKFNFSLLLFSYQNMYGNVQYIYSGISYKLGKVLIRKLSFSLETLRRLRTIGAVDHVPRTERLISLVVVYKHCFSTVLGSLYLHTQVGGG